MVRIRNLVRVLHGVLNGFYDYLFSDLRPTVANADDERAEVKLGCSASRFLLLRTLGESRDHRSSQLKWTVEARTAETPPRTVCWVPLPAQQMG